MTAIPSLRNQQLIGDSLVTHGNSLVFANLLASHHISYSDIGILLASHGFLPMHWHLIGIPSLSHRLKSFPEDGIIIRTAKTNKTARPPGHKICKNVVFPLTLLFFITILGLLSYGKTTRIVRNTLWINLFFIIMWRRFAEVSLSINPLRGQNLLNRLWYHT